MEIVNIILLIVIFVILLFMFLKPKNGEINEINELKKEILELKTKQLEAQAESLRKQQELFIQTQNMINAQLQGIMKTVNENLTNTSGNIINQLKIVHDIEKKLGELQETSRQMQEIGKDISSLQDIFKAPKIRGNIGEMLLENLLGQIFPKENFEMQYQFKDSTKVDAVIKLGQKIVPVDSKFPLEDFQKIVEAKDNKTKGIAKAAFIRNVKGKIDSIAENYIKPDEGTYNFALMYIPAENVYYEVIINESFREDDKEKGNEILNYAIEKKVIPVSPNTMYAYLMAIAYGLKGLKLEQKTEKILSHISAIANDYKKFQESYKTLGGHLKNAIGKYEETSQVSLELGTKIASTAQIGVDETKKLNEF